MRVLIACEYSGRVRDAFTRRCHDAWSCDFLPSETPGQHIQGDILAVLDQHWDLMICHPPCTYLASSGARWWPTRRQEQHLAYSFAKTLFTAPISKIAMENPIGALSSMLRKPDQIIQPWMFGHGEIKATCLWLRGLPKLTPTDVVSGRDARVHKMSPGPNRWKERSRTLEGIASAMAQQWG